MKRFKFRLQKIMQLREQIRDEARQELVRRNSERDHEISVLRYLEHEFDRVGLVEGGTYSANDIVAVGDYSERLKIAIDNQKIVVVAAIKAAELALERYIAASKDAKALEMLRDKKLKEFTEETLREEGALLDELAIQRSVRGEQ
jgi:flagellar FliJ protein